MNKLVYRAVAKTIVALILSMAFFALSHGYPLALWGMYISLAIGLMGAAEAWAHYR